MISISLKVRLTILFFLCKQFASGQIIPGTYVSSKDSVSIARDLPFISYPSNPYLQVNKDRTFSYTWNQPTNCITLATWGSWTFQQDTLYLKDSVYQYIGVGGSGSLSFSLLTTSVYRVANKTLLFLYTVYGKDSAISSRNFMGDFRLYKQE